MMMTGKRGGLFDCTVGKSRSAYRQAVMPTSSVRCWLNREESVKTLSLRGGYFLKHHKKRIVPSRFIDATTLQILLTYSAARIQSQKSLSVKVPIYVRCGGNSIRVPPRKMNALISHGPSQVYRELSIQSTRCWPPIESRSNKDGRVLC